MRLGLYVQAIEESAHGDDVVTQQLQNPEGQVARIEQIMVTIVHREFAPGVSVVVNHRFGSLAQDTNAQFADYKPHGIATFWQSACQCP